LGFGFEHLRMFSIAPLSSEPATPRTPHRQRAIGFQLAHCTVRCGVAVQRDCLRGALLAFDRFADERLGGRDVAFSAQPEVDRPAFSLLYRYRQSDSQALSVWLCTRNDAFVNLAVIAAGAGVWASGTHWPDIAVAAVIAFLGLSSATRIIRQALGEMRSSSGAVVPAE